MTKTEQLTRVDAGVAALERVQANVQHYRAAVLKAACEGSLVPNEADLHEQGKTSDFESGATLLRRIQALRRRSWDRRCNAKGPVVPSHLPDLPKDRKSTRLNSSHSQISYAVFCLKKKKQKKHNQKNPDEQTRSDH